MHKCHRYELWAGSLIFLLFLIVGARLTSPVQTENLHLAGGVCHDLFFRYDLYRVNPPLVRSLAALPVLPKFDRDSPDWRHDDPNPLKRCESLVALELISKRPDFRNLVFYARLAVLPLILVGAIVVFCYAVSLYGRAAAVVAMLLWCFNPYTLGHGCTMMPDVPSAALAVASVFFFRKWLLRAGCGSAFVSGLVLGLAELTKFTLIIFYPLYILLWIFYRLPKIGVWSSVALRRQLFQLVLMLATSLLVVNMGYFFEGTGLQLKSFRFKTALFTGCETLEDVPHEGGNRFTDSKNIVERALGYLPMPLPKNYVQGIDAQRFDFEKGLPSYLRGRWSDHGWWYYYLYALLVKTPLGTIGILLLAIFSRLFFRSDQTDWREEMLLLLPGCAIVIFVSSQTGFSVHSRYIIPALPFFIIWMSKVGKVFSPEANQKSLIPFRCVRRLVLFLLMWSCWSVGTVFPDSIAYFNGLTAVIPVPEQETLPHGPEPPCSLLGKSRYLYNVGVRDGPRHLLNSNVDWGQGVFALERWCKKHPEVREIKTYTWPCFPIGMTSVPSTGLPPADKPKPGWYAISVNYLFGRDEKYRYFRRFTPEEIVGCTIYVYRLTAADIRKAERLEQIEEQVNERDQKF